MALLWVHAQPYMASLRGFQLSLYTVGVSLYTVGVSLYTVDYSGAFSEYLYINQTLKVIVPVYIMFCFMYVLCMTATWVILYDGIPVNVIKSA